jgi:hypothetical protein
MSIFRRRDIHEKIKGLAIGTVALLAMTVPMLCPDAAQAKGPRIIPLGPPATQNGFEPSPPDESQPVDASSRTLGCGTATNIGQANMAPLYVDGNPCLSEIFMTNTVAYTNIKICPPGSQANCQVIDHVIVDTGSVGLRIGYSVLKNNPNLLAGMQNVSTGGAQILTNCQGFFDGSSLYGPVQTADVYIADTFAPNFPLQIFGQIDPGSNVCGSPEGIKQFGANGIVGVRISPLGAEGSFYSCNTDGKSSCTGCTFDGSKCTTENTTYNPIPNLVSQLKNDNNGFTIDLHNIQDSGATVPVLGLLILGVGTQADNTPPEGIIPLQAPGAYINLTIGNNTASGAIIDSGTSVLFINDPDLPPCPVNSFFYCPITTKSKNPTPTTPISLGLSSNTATTPAFDVTYKVGNADALFFNGIALAYNDLAASADGLSPTLGLPMFFGRTMYFVFDGQQSPLGTGPINAIWPQEPVTAAAQ